MKTFLPVFLASCLVLSKTASAFSPFRVSFDDLTSTKFADESLESDFSGALSTNGILSITGLPAAAKEAAMTMAATQHACLMDSTNKQEQLFQDGTVRRTLATHSVAGVGGIQLLAPKTSSPSQACATFEAASFTFRQTTQVAVSAFAKHVTQGFKTESGALLSTAGSVDKGDSPFAFSTFADVVENGDHLEHFHSYQKIKDSFEDRDTIEVHTDQGLFLVFTPGHLASGELTKGFYIESASGEIQEVAFETQDELIFMLGDGVNQYVNGKIGTSHKLRAVPHTLRLDANADVLEARVWYGLMVLPPSSAVHPAYDGITFGEIRQGLVGGDHDVIQLACSGAAPHERSTSSGRFLEEAGALNTTCQFEEEVFCWHRCMNATDYMTSVNQCQIQNQTLQCVNPRGQVSDGDKHGDFYPFCANQDAENVTDFPTLPDSPRDDSLCTEFATKFGNSDGAYSNSISLTGGKGAFFQYSRTGDTVEGRLAFNGIFGYLSVGFVGWNPSNAMLDGRVIMAYKGGNYSAITGQDLELENTVEEFQIDSDQLHFRHWQEPYYVNSGVSATQRNSGSRALNEQSYEVIEDECYTVLKFHVNEIAGQKFNFTGVDTLMWAANDVDYFAQYHGKNQGIFNITWAEGSGSFATSTVGALLVALSVFIYM